MDTYEKRYATFNATKSNVDVVVNGDGSSVVNVYYDRKEYTLKFYYAMEDTDNSIYYVIGGSTYYFGKSGTDTANSIDNITNYYMDGATYVNSRGQVDEIPTLNSIGNERYTSGRYTLGYDTATKTTGNWWNPTTYNYNYYYISFTAKYGSDISDLWPCNVFNSVTRVGKDSTNGWSGEEAFCSAWNGEYRVYYSQKNSNQTIKGNYNLLDYQLLWDYTQASSFGDSSTVDFLCFWENGANINWSVPKLFRYNIYVPKLDDGTTYYLLDSYDTCDDSNVDQQTAPAISGFQYLTRDDNPIEDYDTTLYSDAKNVNFYYARNQLELRFYNHNEYINGKTQNVPFGTSMESFFFVPDYPDQLEENAYRFAGWYTTSGCFEGSEYGNFVTDADGEYISSDFTGYTMPANNLTLYAKWVPIVHHVQFFTSYDEKLQYESDMAGSGTSTVSIYASYEKEHGTVIGSVTNPTRTSSGSMELIFAGWFYMENGEKKAFSPLDMPINKDMNIFADWGSSQPQPYRISYVLNDDHAVNVANDTTGYGYGGTTRTFTAKAGNPYNQLYETYNNGYFPTVNSHSITIQYEADKNNPVTNLYTFYYVHATNINYTVRYINKETNVVMEEVVKTTNSAVVTERFKSFTDMVPDAFYKRLVLSVEYDEETGKWVGSKDNIINFYYTTNTTSAFYAVHYMMEKPNATAAEKENYAIDGSGGYEESETHVEGVGDVGNIVSITPQTFPGFTLIDGKAVTVMDGSQSSIALSSGQYNIEIKASGTELYIFYARNSYNYNVYYYEYNTTTAVSDAVSGTALYGSSVTQTAKNIAGYTCVSSTTQTMTIRDKEDQNFIIFYYKLVQYTVEYVAVPPAGGTLSNTLEVIAGGDSLAGSTPKAYTYYEFVGWYLDEACTLSADTYGTIDPTTKQFTPDKSQLSETERNIFYAKFIQKAGDLTIKRTNAGEENQVFVYEVKNNTTGEIITVTITGTGSVTIKNLLFGEYTVTQQNDWSWRYGDTAQSVIHNATNTEVSFTESAASQQWLNGNSPVIVNKKGA